MKPNSPCPTTNLKQEIEIIIEIEIMLGNQCSNAKQ
jgi:hypothetical protein